MEAIDIKNSLQTCEVELVYHNKIKPSERLQLRTSNDTYEFLLRTWNKGKLELIEQFKVVLLNNACRVLGLITIANGSVKYTMIDAKSIFQATIKSNATQIILAHNHPGGNLTPSIEDEKCTRRLIEMAEILDIRVIEHIILTREGYYSFADSGSI